MSNAILPFLQSCVSSEKQESAFLPRLQTFMKVAPPDLEDLSYAFNLKLNETFSKILRSPHLKSEEAQKLSSSFCTKVMKENPHLFLSNKMVFEAVVETLPHQSKKDLEVVLVDMKRQMDEAQAKRPHLKSGSPPMTAPHQNIQNAIKSIRVTLPFKM